MTEHTKFYGWKLLAVLWLIMLANFGFTMYGSSVMNAYMAEEMHFDRSTLGISFGIFQLMCGVPGPLVAVLINKKGVRFTLVAGCVLVLIGALLMALYVRTSLQVFIVFGLVVGLGAITGGPLAAQTGIGRWFDRHKAFAISLVLTGAAIGGFVAPPILDRVIAASGQDWRAGWWLIIACSAFSILLSLFFVKEKPSDLGQVPDGQAQPAREQSVAAHVGKRGVYHSAEEWTFAEVMRSKAFWLILLAAFGFSAGFSTFIAHGVVHLKDLGHTPAQAASAISIMMLAALAGNIIVAGLGDHIEPRFIWAVASAGFGVGTLLALRATGLASMYVVATLLGLGFGISFPCLMTIPGNYFGHKAYASVIGIYMLTGTSIGGLASFGSGFVYDHMGSYTRAFYVVAALCFAAFFILIFLKPPVYRAQRPLIAAATVQR